MLAERVQEWTREWREEGREEGRKEGREEGEAIMLARLLQHRFDDVPTWAYDKIAKADLPTLEGWSLRILDADSLDTVFQQ